MTAASRKRHARRRQLERRRERAREAARVVERAAQVLLESNGRHDRIVWKPDPGSNYELTLEEIEAIARA